MAIVVGGAYLAVGVGAELALGTFRPWSAEYRFAGTIHPNAQGVQLAVLCLASFCLARRRHPRTDVALGVLCRGAGLSAVDQVAGVLREPAGGDGRPLARHRLGTRAGAGRFDRGTGGLRRGPGRFLLPRRLGDRLLGAVMLGREEQSEGLTGRIPLWNELLGYAQARPLQGYGYPAFWTDKQIDDVSDDMEWTLREAHNGYLDTVLSVGLIGGAILLAIVVVGLARAAAGYRATRRPGPGLPAGLAGLLSGRRLLGERRAQFHGVLAETGLVQLMTVL